MIKKIVNFCIIFILTFSFMFISIDSSSASAPHKEEVKYNGNGKVEVEFYGDVQWKNHNPKVTVKDTKGKKYKVDVYSFDDDEIKFKIKKFKYGKKYKFTIKNVKEFNTKSYSKVTGSVKIPKKSSKSVTRDKARSIALNHAVKKYNIKKSKIYDYDIEKDYYRGTPVWEVDFETSKNGYEYSYDYKIKVSSGKILYHEEEWDD